MFKPYNNNILIWDDSNEPGDQPNPMQPVTQEMIDQQGDSLLGRIMAEQLLHFHTQGIQPTLDLLSGEVSYWFPYPALEQTSGIASATPLSGANQDTDHRLEALPTINPYTGNQHQPSVVSQVATEDARNDAAQVESNGTAAEDTLLQTRSTALFGGIAMPTSPSMSEIFGEAIPTISYSHSSYAHAFSPTFTIMSVYPAP